MKYYSQIYYFYIYKITSLCFFSPQGTKYEHVFHPNRQFWNSHIKFDKIIAAFVSSLGCSELHGNCAENNHVNIYQDK